MCDCTKRATGTGTLTLSGSYTGFETFSEIGDGNTTFYCCTDGTDFEIGIGTYATSGTTLARSVLQSSNSDNLVSWSSGTKQVFVTLPAQKIVHTSNLSTEGATAGFSTEDPTALAIALG